MHIFIIENFGFDLQEGDAKLLQKMNECSVLAFRVGVLNSDFFFVKKKKERISIIVRYCKGMNIIKSVTEYDKSSIVWLFVAI